MISFKIYYFITDKQLKKTCCSNRYKCIKLHVATTYLANQSS